MKYSIPEIERRWLVDAGQLPDLSTLKRVSIVDRYIRGTRLRLRMLESAEGTKYKLCKKYGKESQFTENITNIYLSLVEFSLLVTLPAKVVNRERYYLQLEDVVMSINLPDGNHPIIAECEFGSLEKARAFVPPEFCTEEVSDREEYQACNFSNCDEPDARQVIDEAASTQ
jgi:CYTH domain-containing protein